MLAEWVSRHGVALEVVQTVTAGELWLRANAAACIAVVVKLGTTDDDRGLALAASIRTWNPSLFVCVSSRTAMNAALTRLRCFRDGVNMVTSVADDPTALSSALSTIIRTRAHRSGEPLFSCPYCGMKELTSEALWLHMPLYHINMRAPVGRVKCPVCSASVREFQVHMHEDHRPAFAGPGEDRSPMRLHAFGLVVCRRPSDGKFLLVQEFAGQGFWLPGGRVDTGETPAQAAVRESQEEAGAAVRLTGVLSVEFSAAADGHARMRVIFLAEPVCEPCVPKTLPDFESVGACWVSLEEIQASDMVLRGSEPLVWCAHVANGGHVSPMSLFSKEEY